MTLRNYSSTAASTTLTSGVSAANTSILVAATTGFPAAPFIIAVDAGAAAQELMLVTNVAGLTLTVTRGYDSTVAVTHDVGAVVQHSHGAIDFREANTHVNATSGVHGTTGDLVGTMDTQTLTGKTVALGSNTISGTKAQFNAAMTDADFKTSTDTEFSAWAAYTPTLSGATQGNGTVTGGYVQIGKTVHFWAKFTLGSTSTMGTYVGCGLPVPARSAAAFGALSSMITDAGSTSYVGLPSPHASEVRVYAVHTGGAYAAVGTLTSTVPHTWAAGDLVDVRGTYEAA